MPEIAIKSAVIDCLAELTGCSPDRIADGDLLVEDLGVDSLLAVNLLVAVEERLGRAIPDGCEADLATARTVGELARNFALALMPDVGAPEVESGQPIAE